MVKKIGFDNDKYLEDQSKAILERVKKFDRKLYLEFGGKLCFDYHAARVLPGYDPAVKMKLLKRLKDKIDIIFCVYARDVEKGRIRGDFGMTYDVATLKAIDDLMDWDLSVSAVVITRFKEEPAAIKLINKLNKKNITVYTHKEIEGYPGNIEQIISEEGYGRNSYIETENPIVVVTAPGPGSGKLATCLSQLYHDHKKRINSGYAKFETFPIWNLPLKHPVNIAYEAATADINDFNLTDPFHLAAYKEKTINYNRDIEAFPILKNILNKIIGRNSEVTVYNSPTDMGVNQAGFAITDEEVVKEAARQEIIRRYFRYNWEFVMGIEREETIERTKKFMEEVGVKPEDRSTVLPAREAAREAEEKKKSANGLYCGAAIELPDGKIVIGKNSSLLHATSAAVLNAVKILAKIPDTMHLLPSTVIKNLANLKKDILEMKSESLDLEETLVALSISATANPAAEETLGRLKELRGCELHMTHIPPAGDEEGLRKLGINATTDAIPASRYFLR